MTSSYRRSSAEPGLPSSATSSSTAESYPIIEECSKEQGVIRRFTKGRFLGKGGFAKCYEFTNLETKKTLAAKVIPKNSLTKNRARQKLMSEIKIHRSLRHTNIVGFEHFFEDHENVYILLEICTNQTMNELLKRRKRLTELEVQCYLTQILSAIKHLHKYRVIHRDLKLGNLFLSDKMEIKLGDFGLATKLDYDGERKRTICGTPNYIAPEILEGKDSGHSYEVDVWSFGVIAYTLLIGKPPFETNDVKATYKRIRMNEYSFPEGAQISAAAKNMIKRILLTDPAKRLTVDEIIAHEFLAGVNIPKLLPVSTLACPPSSQYVRSFQTQSQQANSADPSIDRHNFMQQQQSQQQVQSHVNHHHAFGLLGRSNSPRRFENTTPLSNVQMPLQSQQAHSANSSSNVRSQQQLIGGAFKDTKKEFGSTYRTASAQMISSSGAAIIGQQQQQQNSNNKNYDTNNVNNQRIEDELYAASGFQRNEGVAKSATTHQLPSTMMMMSSGAISHNLSGSNTMSYYNNKQQYPQQQQQQQQQQQPSSVNSATQQAYQPIMSSNIINNNNNSSSSCGMQQQQPNSQSSQQYLATRNLLEKYSSNSNAAGSIVTTAAAAGSSSQSGVSNNGSGSVRAKSEKLNTQPTGSSSNSNNNSSKNAQNALMASYGIAPIASNTHTAFNGIATLSSNLSSTNLKNNLLSTAATIHSGATNSETFQQQQQIITTTTNPTNSILAGSDIWVKKWVDYSSKYGLGYLLSNGQVGVFFNDSTKIILNTANDEFEYYERKSSDKQDVGQSHKLNTYPSELQKKVLLLQHFRSYLEGDDKQIESSVQQTQQQQQQQSNNNEEVGAHGQQQTQNNNNNRIYLKKWLRSKDAILFRLSNKVVQVIFLDKTEIILSNEMHVVTYVNKKHERHSYPLTSAMESTNLEMAKRLRYTKEILTHMLSNGSSSSASAASKSSSSSGATAATSSAVTSRNTTNANTHSTGTTSSAQQNHHALQSGESRSNIIKASSSSQSSSNLQQQQKQMQSHQQQQQSMQSLQQQRENLHYSKSTTTTTSSTAFAAGQQQQQQSQQQIYPSNPPSIPINNNYMQAQNENVNTILNKQNSLSSQKHNSQLISNYMSGKKEGDKQTGGVSSEVQMHPMKSNQSLMRMNSLNAMTSASSSSLSNLNHFNNYIISSRKTEA